MTNHESMQQPYPQNPQAYYEDEINLIDYLRVLWKWKRLIIAGTLICAVIAIVISLQMPKIYEVSMTVEPGITGVKYDGSFIYVDSAANIDGKIGGGVYDKKAVEALQLDPLKTMVKFKSEIVKKTNMIRVTSQWQEGDTDLGVKVAQQIIGLLSSDYVKIIEQRKGDYDRQIFMKQNEISKVETQRKDIDKQILMKQNEISKVETQRKDIDKQILTKQNEISKIETKRKDIDKQIKLKLSENEKTRNDIRLQQATLENIRQRKGELLGELKGVKENTEKIVLQRDVLLKGKTQDGDISLLLYSNTIQQNVAYFNRLSDQVYDLGTREKETEAKVDRLTKNIDDIKTEIERFNLNKTEGLQAQIYDIKTKIEKIKLHKTEGLQTSIHDINAQINTLNLEKGLISNVKIIQEPDVSLHPVKPKKKQIVLLASVVALFMFIFLAFFVEYIKNAPKSK